MHFQIWVFKILNLYPFRNLVIHLHWKTFLERNKVIPLMLHGKKRWLFAIIKGLIVCVKYVWYFLTTRQNKILSTVWMQKTLLWEILLIEETYFFVENFPDDGKIFVENFLYQGKIFVCGNVFDQGKILVFGKLS